MTNAAVMTKGNGGGSLPAIVTIPAPILAICYVFVTIPDKNLHPDSSGLRQLAEKVDGSTVGD